MAILTVTQSQSPLVITVTLHEERNTGVMIFLFRTSALTTVHNKTSGRAALQGNPHVQKLVPVQSQVHKDQQASSLHHNNQ